MPMDKIKHPDCFPKIFLDVLEYGEGRFTICRGVSKAICKNKARKYRAFIKSLRAFSNHPLSAILDHYEIRTRRERQSKHLYSLVIVVKEKITWKIL